MPLRALVTAAILVLSTILLSTTLLAQHSSGGGGFSGGGGSHASSGGFSSASSGSSASSHTSSGSSSSAHSSTTGSPSSRTGSATPSRVSEPKSGAKSESPSHESPNLEKKSFWGFLHKKPEPKSDLVTRTKWPIGCKKGEACRVCPTGGMRNAGGACVSPVNTCSAGQVWNGASCGLRSQWNDCSRLADQLTAQERQMQGQSDPGQSAFYQLLRRQYEACLARSGYHSAGYASPFANLSDPLTTR
jgi:hypothetical protein